MTVNNFIHSINTVKNEWAPYQKWEKEWNDREAQRKALYDKVPVAQKDLDRAKNFGQTFDNVVEIIDENNENTSNNIDSLVNPLSVIATIGTVVAGGVHFVNTAEEWKNEKLKSAELNETRKHQIDKKYIGKLTRTLVFVPFAMLAVGVGFSLLSGKLQVLGSKIARYQSHDDLNDPKNFVQYDDEQIAKANELIKSNKIVPSVDNKKSKGGFWGNIVSLIHDYKDYQLWESEHDKNNLTIAKPNPSPEEFNKAKADQDIILRKVKAINDEAKEYSENMVSASGAILNAALLCGGVFGFLVDKALVNIKVGKSGKEKTLAKVMVNALMRPKVVKNKLGLHAETLRKALTSPKSGIRTTIISTLFAVSAGIVSIPITSALKHDASRTGRFAKRKEYMEDNKHYIYFDEQQMETVKDVKADDSSLNFMEKLLDSLKFLPKAIKKGKEYENYKKTTRNQNKQLREALNQVELKPGQLEEAKNIQKKILFSLKKVDEKSLEYSENMGAFTDSVLTAIPYAFLGFLMLPVSKVLDKINNGETSIKELVNKEKTVNTKEKVYGAAVISAKLIGFYLLEAYMAHLQKTAGKIGIMKAMDELKDPRFFVDKYSKEPEKQDNPTKSVNNRMSNWVASLNTNSYRM